MIRKMLIFTVLAVAAAASIILPIWKSDAAQQGPSIGSLQPTATHIAATDRPANYFSIPPKTLTVASVNPNSAVQITVTPNDNGGGGNGVALFKRTYNHNTQVTLTAPATVGINIFQKWQRNGVDFAFTQATNVTMDADYTLTAVYLTAPKTLTVASTNPGSDVSITVSPNDTNNQGPGTTGFSRIYTLNTLVTLTAPVSAGEHTFHKWQRNGVDFSFNPTINLTMSSDVMMTAVYGTRTLTVNSSNPNTGVSITISPDDTNNLGTGTTGFSRTYNLNTNVELTAPAMAGGNVFRKWLRNGLDWSTNQSTSVTMDFDHSMMAVYVSPPAATQTLTVAATNPPMFPIFAGLSITVSPADNGNLGNGTTQFSRTYNHGTNVTLTAPANASGGVFRRWLRNGVVWSTDRSTGITMDSDYTMMAVYGPPINLRTLTVASSNPNGGVSINVSPDFNSLGGTATQFTRLYGSSATVLLMAPATAGVNSFQKWQRNGVDWSTSPTTTVTMDADYTMTAVFIGEDGNTARSAAPVSADLGSTVTVNWTAPGNHPIIDLIALFGAGGLN